MKLFSWLNISNLLDFSDDLLEDSDSEEHSRSESVTGRHIIFYYEI